MTLHYQFFTCAELQQYDVTLVLLMFLPFPIDKKKVSLKLSHTRDDAGEEKIS